MNFKPGRNRADRIRKLNAVRVIKRENASINAYKINEEMKRRATGLLSVTMAPGYTGGFVSDFMAASGMLYGLTPDPETCRITARSRSLFSSREPPQGHFGRETKIERLYRSRASFGRGPIKVPEEACETRHPITHSSADNEIFQFKISIPSSCRSNRHEKLFKYHCRSYERTWIVCNKSEKNVRPFE